MKMRTVKCALLSCCEMSVVISMVHMPLLLSFAIKMDGEREEETQHC